MDIPHYYASAVDLFAEQMEVVYVAPWGSDLNPGTASLPFRTIQVGINAVRTMENSSWEVRVAAGDYTPGAGLSSGGLHGLMIDYDMHQPGLYDDFLPASVTVSFGWDRLFRTNSLNDGGGTTRLLGNGLYQGELFVIYRDGAIFQVVGDNPGGGRVTILAIQGGEALDSLPSELFLQGAFVILPEGEGAP